MSLLHQTDVMPRCSGNRKKAAATPCSCQHSPKSCTEGDTEAEALANAEEAIRALLSYRQDHNIAIPSDALPEVRRVTVAA
jgi:predicted RNase H-like HicB family nuclease